VISDYLLLAAVVFVVNVIPFFGPPTWCVIVFMVAKCHLDVAPTVAIAAPSAAVGRLVLAHAARRLLRGRLSAKRRRSLEVVERALTKNRARRFTALAVFAFSPVPSSELFIAAALMKMRLLPLTIGFFVGRLISYAIYAFAAAEVDKRMDGDMFHAMTTPLAIALEIVMVAALVAFVKIDWARVSVRVRAWRRRRARRAAR